MEQLDPTATGPVFRRVVQGGLGQGRPLLLPDEIHVVKRFLALSPDPRPLPSGDQPRRWTARSQFVAQSPGIPFFGIKRRIC